MKKVIVVRKNKAQRTGNRVLLVIMICAAAIACMFWAPFVQAFLLFFPAFLPMLVIVLYYETWRVSLGPNKITVKCMFFEKAYSYYQITDAYAAHSYTLHEHICLTFSDGKRIIIKSEDDNAGAARRKIQSHHSIRILNWQRESL